MIQRNNNLSPLPFYDNIDEQNHYKSYAYGEVYPLYTPIGSIPPFQLIIHHTTATVSSVTLYKIATATGTDITSAINTAGLIKKNFAANGYDVVLYPSMNVTNFSTEEGRYYIVVQLSNGDRYYSDIFTMVGDMSGYLNLMWWDLNDLEMDNARIVYKDGAVACYRNQLWLQTQLGKPDYDFTEEGETRDGYFFAEKMVSEKKYKCTILAPEYLCDVMRFIRMSDRVYVTDQNGIQYRCDTFLITPKWEQQGDLASVEIEFTCDTVAKKIGKGYVDTGADFNDDYNNDYSINV